MEEHVCLGSPRRLQHVQRDSGRVQQHKPTKKSLLHGQTLPGFQRRTSLLTAFMVQTAKSPNGSQNLFLSPWLLFPMTTMFFHRNTTLGCQEMNICACRNFTGAGPTPSRWEWLGCSWCPKYTQSQSILPLLKEATTKSQCKQKNYTSFEFQNRMKKVSLSLKIISGACKNKDELCLCTHPDFVGGTENPNHKWIQWVIIILLKEVQLLCSPSQF